MGLEQGKAEVSGWQEEGVWGAGLERKSGKWVVPSVFGPAPDLLTPSCRERLSTHILQSPHPSTLAEGTVGR